MAKSFFSSTIGAILIALVFMTGTVSAHHKHKHKYGKRHMTHRHMKHMKM